MEGWREGRREEREKEKREDRVAVLGAVGRLL